MRLRASTYVVVAVIVQWVGTVSTNPKLIFTPAFEGKAGVECSTSVCRDMFDMCMKKEEEFLGRRLELGELSSCVKMSMKDYNGLKEMARKVLWTKRQ